MSKTTKTVYSILLTVEDLIMLSSAAKREIDSYKESIDACRRLLPEIPEAAQTADFFQRQLEKAEKIKNVIDRYLNRIWHGDMETNAG